MTDATPGSDSDPAAPQLTGPPRWVKVLGVIALLILVVLVIGKVVGLEHGPSNHGAAAVIYSAEVAAAPWG